MIPLFYIPGQQTARPALLAQIGLDLGPGHTHAEIPTAGPDGGRGVLVYWPRVDAPHLLPNLNQYAAWKWQPVKPDPERDLPAGRYWLGRVPGETITPEDLARRHQLDGLSAPLDDDHHWQVPAARSLPHRNRLNDAGEMVRTVDEAHRVYFDLAADFQRALAMAGSAVQKQMHVRDAWRLAVMGLAMNYRVNREIVDWLGVLGTDDSLFYVACASFEFAAWQFIEREKKTAVATPVG